MWSWLAQHQDALAALESIVTSLAILAGGIWALRLYLKKREPKPKARIKHTLTHRRLPGNQIWLRVDLSLDNCGNSLLRPKKGLTRVSQILPLHGILPGRLSPPFSRERAWPQLFDDESDWTEMSIEPGEEDSVAYDFVLPGHVKTVLIYSHVENADAGDTPVGWQRATVYEIDDHGERQTEGADGAASPQTKLHEAGEVPRLNEAAGGETATAATRGEEMKVLNTPNTAA